jgi:hypothetical protein
MSVERMRYILIFTALTWVAWKVPDTHHLVTLVIGIAFVVGSLPSLMYFLWNIFIFKSRPPGRHTSSKPKSPPRSGPSATDATTPPSDTSTPDAWYAPVPSHSADTSRADTLAATPFSGARRYMP